MRNAPVSIDLNGTERSNLEYYLASYRRLRHDAEVTSYIMSRMNA
jgi:hypothetical protein